MDWWCSVPREDLGGKPCPECGRSWLVHKQESELRTLSLEMLKLTIQADVKKAAIQAEAEADVKKAAIQADVKKAAIQAEAQVKIEAEKTKQAALLNGKLSTGASVPYSDAHFCFKKLEEAGIDEIERVLEYEGDQSPIDINQSLLAECRNESDLTKVMYPIFKKLCSSDDAELWNTENLKWLPYDNTEKPANGEKYDKKPDFLLMHCAFVERKTNSDISIPEEMRAGSEEIMSAAVPLSTHLIRFARAVLEAKVLPLSNELIGKLLIYLGQMNANGCANAFGVLFNKEEFIVCHCRDNAIVSIKRCYWSTLGSKRFFQEEFVMKSLQTPDQVIPRALTAMCRKLNVPVQCDSVHFIGNGASGFAFSIQDPDNPSVRRALKLNLPLTAQDSVEDEFANLLRIAATSDASVNVVRPLNGGLLKTMIDNTPVLGLLLAEVGKSFVVKSRKDVNRCLDALKSFHSATQCSHGDPRLPNLVNVNETLKWIDVRFMNAGFAMTGDFLVLGKSILMSRGIPTEKMDTIFNELRFGTGIFNPDRFFEMAVLTHFQK